jgi:hypothetical protein
MEPLSGYQSEEFSNQPDSEITIWAPIIPSKDCDQNSKVYIRVQESRSRDFSEGRVRENRGTCNLQFHESCSENTTNTK